MENNAARTLCAGLLLSALAACGGGGGDGSSNNSSGTTPTPSPTTTPTPAPGSGSVTPPTVLAATVVEGQSTPIPAALTYSGQLPANPTLQVSADGDLLSSAASATVSGNTLNVTLNSNAQILPGYYSGTVTLNVCSDASCSASLSGFPVKFPYQISVGFGSHLTTLSALSGATDWSTLQGNNAHNGYVPVTVDASHFSTRWAWQDPQTIDKTSLSPQVVVTGAGRAYVNSSNQLEAVDEASGNLAWSRTFAAFPIAAPATAGSSVYVLGIDALSGVTNYGLWNVSNASGATVATTTSASTTFSTGLGLTPVIDSGTVYVGDYSGKLISGNASTGAVNYATALYNNFANWAPTLDGQNIYAWSNAGLNTWQLKVLDKSTGTASRTVNISGFTVASSPGASQSTPVLGSANSLVVLGDADTSGVRQLGDLDITAGTARWTANGQFASTVAVGNNVVYAYDAATSTLQARDEMAGTVLWTWTLPAQEVGVSATSSAKGLRGLLLTNNVVFFSSAVRTYAISLTTHQALWSTPAAGSLALSANGVLYINAPDLAGAHGIVAVNLQ